MKISRLKIGNKINEVFNKNIILRVFTKEYKGIIDTCHHLFESAGEYAWNLLGFTENIIASSKVFDKKKEITEELLGLTYNNKQKKLGGIQ